MSTVGARERPQEQTRRMNLIAGSLRELGAGLAEVLHPPSRQSDGSHCGMAPALRVMATFELARPRAAHPQQLGSAVREGRPRVGGVQRPLHLCLKPQLKESPRFLLAIALPRQYCAITLNAKIIIKTSRSDCSSPIRAASDAVGARHCQCCPLHCIPVLAPQ